MSKVSFTYEVERYKNRDTGEYVQLDSVYEDDEFEYEYATILLKIVGTYFYQKGRYYGEPEDCFPDESEAEMISCIGPDGKNWELNLSEKESNNILDQIAVEASDNYDDRDYNE